MTDERDPMLQALFADAEHDLPHDEFVARVMASTRQHKRTSRIVWMLAVVIVIPIAWLIMTIAHDSVLLLTQSLTNPLVALDDRLLAQLLSPVNNFGFLLALVVIGIRLFYKKIFSTPG
jgi:hypothetical protein